MPARLTTALRLITRTSIVATVVLSASAGAAVGQAGPAAAAGGNLSMLASSDIDYLDPGHTYYTFGEMVTLATNRPLYSFKTGDANKTGPGLSGAEPQNTPHQVHVTR